MIVRPRRDHTDSARDENGRDLIVVDDATPAAVRHTFGCYRVSRRSVAGTALRVTGEEQGGGETLGRVCEIEVEGCLDIGASLWARRRGRTAATSPPAEHLTKEVAETFTADIEVVAA